MKKPVKRVLTVLLILLLLPIVLLALAIGYLNTPWGQDMLRDKAVSQLESLTDLNIQIGDLSTSVLGSLTLEDVRVRHKTVADSTNLLAFDRLHVEYNLLPLLSKTIRIDTVYVDSLAGHVVKLEDGRTNLPVFPSDTTKKEPKPFPFEFDVGGADINLADGSYHDRGQPLKVTVDSLMIHLAGSMDDADYSLSWGNAELNTKDRRLIVKSFYLGGTVKGDTVNVDSLTALTPGADLGGQGDVEYAAGPDSARGVQAGVYLQGDAGELSRHLEGMIPPMLSPLEGNFIVDATLSGSAADPNARINFRSSRLRAGKFLADSLAIVADANMREVVVDTLHLASFGGRIDGNGRVGLDSMMQHRVNLDLRNINVQRLESTFTADSVLAARPDTVPPPVRGTLRGHIESSGPLANIWSIQANADVFANLQAPNDSSAGLKLNLDYQDHNANLRLTHGKLKLTADAVIDSTTLRGSFALNVPELHEIVRLAGIDSLHGDLSGKGDFRGSPSAPVVNASLKSTGITYRRLPLDTLFARVRYDTSAIELREAHLAGEITAIDTAAPPVGMAGMHGRNIRYEANVSGVIPDGLDGSMTLSGDALEVGPIAADSLRAKVLFQGREIELASLRLHEKEKQLAAEGYYKLPSSRGGLTVWFPGGGEADEGEDGDDEDRSDDEESADSESMPDSTFAADSTFASVDSTLADSTLTARLTEQGPIGGDGRLRMEIQLPDSSHRSMQLSARGGDLPLGKVPRIHPGLENLRGLLGLKADLQGDLANPQGTVQLTLDSLRTEQFTLDSLNLASRFTRREIEANLRARFANSEPIRAQAIIPLTASPDSFAISHSRKISARIQAPRIDMALFNTFLPEEMGIDGNLKLDYTASGTLDSPSVQGTLRVDSAAVSLGPEKPGIDSLFATIVQEDSLITLKRVRAHAMKNPMSLAGKVMLEPDGATGDLTLSIRDMRALIVDGRYGPDGYAADVRIPELPLEPFESLVPSFTDMKGIVSGTAKVQGDTGLPQINGTIRGRDINLDFAAINEYVDDGRFTLSFDQNRLVIDSLEANFAKRGRINGAGSVELYDGNVFYDLSVEGRDLRIDDDDYTVRVDKFDIGFQSHDVDYHVLSGDVYLGPTEYTKNYRIDMLLRQLNAPPTRQISKPNPMAENIHLDVRLREGDEITISNNLAELELDANLRATGTMADPTVTGRVLLAEGGTVNYLDHRFEVQRGIIDFVDTRDINPYLNISAMSEVSYYTEGERIVYDVTLTVTGNMKSAKIEFTSDPYLDQSSVISLLTFGNPNAGQGGVAGSAGSLAGRALGGYVGTRVGGAVGLDNLSIQGNIFSPEESNATLRATKQITKRAEVTYITDVGTFNENAIRITYYLSQWWTLSGETNQEGEGSVDVEYRVRFE